MKIKRSELKRIIQEELGRVLNEQGMLGMMGDAVRKAVPRPEINPTRRVSDPAPAPFSPEVEDSLAQMRMIPAAYGAPSSVGQEDARVALAGTGLAPDPAPVPGIMASLPEPAPGRETPLGGLAGTPMSQGGDRPTTSSREMRRAAASMARQDRRRADRARIQQMSDEGILDLGGLSARQWRRANRGVDLDDVARSATAGLGAGGVDNPVAGIGRQAGPLAVDQPESAIAQGLARQSFKESLTLEEMIDHIVNKLL